MTIMYVTCLNPSKPGAEKVDCIWCISGVAST